MTKLGEFIQEINQELLRPCPNHIRAELEVINGQILATILDGELAQRDKNYYEQHNSSLMLRETKLDELLWESQATNDEIVSNELSRRKAESQRKCNSCIIRVQGRQDLFQWMERRRKILKARKRVILAEWQRISNLQVAGEGGPNAQ